jgi:hypothetical protein
MDRSSKNQVGNPNDDPKPRLPRRSYFFRAGQVEQVLRKRSRITIYDIAREIGISPRSADGICRRMVVEGRITFEVVPHSNHFKYLVSLAK